MLLSSQPQFIDKCDKISEIDEFNWPLILEGQPQLSYLCSKWKDFDSSSWSILLSKQRQFIAKAKEYKAGWVGILANYPNTTECPYWDKFDNDDWEYLLYFQPQFVSKCNKFEDFDVWNWDSLLCKNPDFFKLAEKYPNGMRAIMLLKRSENRKRKNYEKMPSRELTDRLIMDRRLADDFDKFDLWKRIDNNDWGRLLSKQPQFAEEEDCPQKIVMTDSDCTFFFKAFATDSTLIDEFNERNLWEKFENNIISQLSTKYPQMKTQ